MAVALLLEGHYYQGPIENGCWVDAANLKSGSRLLNDDESWAEVVSVEIENEALKAYNLTIFDYHTYFVKGADNANPVWVNNACTVDATFPSRNAALRGAKEKAGIPRSAKVKEVYSEFLRDGDGKPMMGSNNRLVATRNYVYTHPEYGQVVYRNIVEGIRTLKLAVQRLDRILTYEGIGGIKKTQARYLMYLVTITDN